MTDERAAARAEYLKELNISFSTTFIPQSMSRHAESKERSLNWKVKLARGGREIVTDYMQGIGHVPGWQQLDSLRRTLYYEPVRKDFEGASETGKYPKDPFIKHHHEHGVRIDVRFSYPLVALPEPTLDEVLYCLVLDGSARNYNFEEWCGEFGYDTDSRKAHAAYMSCFDIGQTLVRLVGGEENLKKLEELYQDY